MSSGRRKLYYASGCILIVMLLCTAGGIGTIKWYQRMTDCHDGRLPLRSLEIIIDVTQQQKFIDQFRKFADKNEFQFHLVNYTPNGHDFLIDLIRKDIEVIATNPFRPAEFNVGFYNNDCIHPTVASDIDGLVVDLKSFLSQIPNAVISAEK
jgi:hypothetical protein